VDTSLGPNSEVPSINIMEIKTKEVLIHNKFQPVSVRERPTSDCLTLYCNSRVKME